MLRPKQEKFCQEYIKCGNASEAYRKAYSTQNMKPETINRKAKELIDNGKIAARIEELNSEIKNKNIADAQEIQEFLTRLIRGQDIEEVPMNLNGIFYMASKTVTPKDRIKACEMLAKMIGAFNININVKDVPIIEDNI